MNFEFPNDVSKFKIIGKGDYGIVYDTEKGYVIKESISEIFQNIPFIHIFYGIAKMNGIGSIGFQTVFKPEAECFEIAVNRRVRLLKRRYQ